MSYHINLCDISLNDYKTRLASADLLPSRMILKDNTDHHFSSLIKAGIDNLSDLVSAIGTKKKLQKFVMVNDFDVDYLTILIREVKSMIPKPTLLKDFPVLSDEIYQKLEKFGLKNSVQLYDRILTNDSRLSLAKETKINEHDLLVISHLTDLVRIRWVNHTFAYMLYLIDINTAKKVSEADYHYLHKAVNKLNEEKNFYRGRIGLHDFKLIVDSAQDLDYDIDL